MFCVECGREDELIGSLCVECYAKKHAQASLPDHLDLTLCAHCSSMLTKRGWEDIGSIREAAQVAVEEALVVSKDARAAEVRVHLAEKDERNLEARVSAVLSVDGHQFERELRTIIRLKRGSCDECSKQQGKYYEAVLQVRGLERALPCKLSSDVERIVKDRVAASRKTSRDVFLSKVERVTGGLDFYFSTVALAKSVAKELQDVLCAEYKESSSLWGRKDGKDVHRMTFMVRAPGFGKGDVIEHGSRYYYVLRMSKGIVHGVDLETGEEHAVKLKAASECALVRSKDEIKRAVVVMESDTELQVLDPETMSTVDVKKPYGFVRSGGQVRLVKTGLGTFVLSDSW